MGVCTIEKVNPDDYDKIFVVGDIHGMYNKLSSLLDCLDYTERSLIVFLGDYIDRGKKSAEVIDRVMLLAQETNVIALKGNHEYMAYQFYQKHSEGLKSLNSSETQYFDDDWLFCGGVETLSSFLQEPGDVEEVLDRYFDWIGRRPHIVQLGDNIFMSHAGFNVEKSLAKQNEEDVVWLREQFYDHYNGSDTWYVGHTPVQLLYVFEGSEPVRPVKFTNNIYMMDTGSFMDDGKISCIELKQNKLYQSK